MIKLGQSQIKFINRFVKYFGVALVGYAVDFGTLIVLHQLLGLHYLIATSVGFILGLVIIYLLSNRYVFGTSKFASKSADFGLFGLIGLVGLILLNALMLVFVDFLAVNYIASKIIATIFVYLWNFFARSYLYQD